MTDEEINTLARKFEVGSRESPDWAFAWHDFARAIIEAAAQEPDAKRYRWLRAQFVNSDPPPAWVMTQPKNLKLGSFCPSEERMDQVIDAALESTREKP